MLLRDYDAARADLIPAPRGDRRGDARAAEGRTAARGSGEGEVKVEGGMAEVRVNLGEHLIEWTRA